MKLKSQHLFNYLWIRSIEAEEYNFETWVSSHRPNIKAVCLNLFCKIFVENQEKLFFSFFQRRNLVSIDLACDSYELQYKDDILFKTSYWRPGKTKMGLIASSLTTFLFSLKWKFLYGFLSDIFCCKFRHDFSFLFVMKLNWHQKWQLK